MRATAGNCAGKAVAAVRLPSLSFPRRNSSQWDGPAARRREQDVPAGTKAMASSSDALRAPARVTALSTLIRQRGRRRAVGVKHDRKAPMRGPGVRPNIRCRLISEVSASWWCDSGSGQRASGDDVCRKSRRYRTLRLAPKRVSVPWGSQRYSTQLHKHLIYNDILRLVPRGGIEPPTP